MTKKRDIPAKRGPSEKVDPEIEVKEPNESQKVFCREYVLDFNATRAYSVAYPNEKGIDSIKASASRLLTFVYIKTFISELQKDIEATAGLSRLMVANEYKKLAFSNIANLHNTWIDRKAFEELTDNERACIQEIDTKVLVKNTGTKDEPDYREVEYVRIKLYDKKAALDSLSKLLGYNSAEKVDHTTGGEKIKQTAIIVTSEEARENLKKFLEND